MYRPLVELKLEIRIQITINCSRATGICVASMSEPGSSPITMRVRLERDMPQLAQGGAHVITIVGSLVTIENQGGFHMSSRMLQLGSRSLVVGEMLVLGMQQSSLGTV